MRIVSDIKKAHKKIIKNKYDSFCTFTEALLYLIDHGFYIKKK